MNIPRKICYGLAVVLLILFFPAIFGFSSTRIVDNNHQIASKAVVHTKFASIQAAPIVITNNNGFTPAGFTGYGNVTHPYVLDGNIVGKIEASGSSGINISNTNAYFRIENMQINGSTDLFNGGIKLEDVSNGLIINTSVTNSYYGFYLVKTNYTIMTENKALGNIKDGFYMTGYCSFNSLTGNIASNNTGNGFYIRYFSNNNSLIDNKAINNTAIGFSLDDSHNSTFTENIAIENAFGFDLYFSSSFNNLTGNIAAKNSQRGYVLLSGSNNNLFVKNHAMENGDFGFFLDNVDFNTFTENNATRTGRGFRLWACNNNTFSRNTVTNNDYGFDLDTSCDNNSLTYNTVSDNTQNGILLQSSNSENVLSWNVISNTSSYGIKLDSSSNNLIYYNFFINNNEGNVQGYDALTNNWDNGTHGNYWSDYTGIDIGNGIGNINYTIEGPDANDTKPLVFTLTLIGPNDLDFEAGSPDESITWFPENYFPLTTIEDNSYILYLEEGQSDSGSWIAGGNIEVDIPVLSPGIYNFTLVISDSSGTMIADTVLVTMIDTIHPVITYTGQDEVSFEVGSTRKTLNVTVTDLYPETYILYQDGNEVNSSSWASGVMVSFSFDDFSLPIGVYNFTLVAYDTSGNEAAKTIIVTVTSSPVTTATTTSPVSTLTMTSATTASKSSTPGWTAPLALFTLAFTGYVLSSLRSQRKK